ncbi:MAG: hypothetical protein R2791_03670 [Saprospiraceae bacterium]
MKLSTLIISLILLANCHTKEKSILVCFPSNVSTQDTAIFQKEKIILNEYYKISVYNSLYDTIYLTLSNLSASRNEAVLPSKISTYKKSGLSAVTAHICNFKMQNNSTVAIGRETSHDLLFYMPECSDTSILKGYLFLIGYDSAKTVFYRYMEVLSKYQNNRTCQKVRLTE